MKANKHFTKEFLQAVDDALVWAYQEGRAMTCLYVRRGRLNVRVKVDLAPPEAPLARVEFEEPI